MTFETTLLAEHLTIAASANIFHIAIEHKTNINAAASNINIKIHQLFSEQRILAVFVIIVQRKTSVDLTRNCF